MLRKGDKVFHIDKNKILTIMCFNPSTRLVHFVEYEFRLREKHFRPNTKLEVYVWRDRAEIAVWIDDLKVDIIRKK